MVLPIYKLYYLSFFFFLPSQVYSFLFRYFLFKLREQKRQRNNDNKAKDIFILLTIIFIIHLIFIDIIGGMSQQICIKLQYIFPVTHFERFIRTIFQPISMEVESRGNPVRKSLNCCNLNKISNLFEKEYIIST